MTSNSFRYELWLSRDDGTRLLLLDNVHGFEYVMRIDGRGAFSVPLPSSIDTKTLGILNDQPDRRIEFWRGVGGGPKRLDMVGLVTKGTFFVSGDGQITFVVSGPDLVDLLGRRIIAYDAATAETAKNAEADDVAKAFVRENLGALALTERDITGVGFTVQTDTSQAPVISIGASRQNLAKVLAKVAARSKQAGTRLYYGIVPLTSTTFEFRTWIDQPGQDRTGGENPMVFSLSRGNLEQPRIIVTYDKSANFVYAGGRGREAERVIEDAENAAGSKASLVARREAFKSATNVTSGADVQAAANEKLAKSERRKDIRGVITSAPKSLFGLHWQLGDRVIVDFMGQHEVLINTVKVSVNEDGKERIVGSFDGRTS